ncbi:hypothetical protein SEA_JAEK_87 [Arthrobacter phage Jaek]|uniref:Uncharacterized protein n=1 Tax=Arthrobacter phage Jaek TaxID=2599826 RepID=A0A5J6TSY8_9CAUD|nr:hypothetical protein SEA_JAEK_87 [Arthrobacter phage Jaek]
MCYSCEQRNRNYDEDDESPDYDRWESFADWLEDLSESQLSELAGVSEPDDYDIEIIQALRNIAQSFASEVRDDLRDGACEVPEFIRTMENSGYAASWSQSEMLWNDTAVKAVCDIKAIDDFDILANVRNGQTISEACVSQLTNVFSRFLMNCATKRGNTPIIGTQTGCK